MVAKISLQFPSMMTRFSPGSYQGEKSTTPRSRLYYGGSVPFLWESQPGTPKHKLSDGPLPPLTPPPRFQSSPLASPSLRKKHSKIFNSIFARASSKKMSANSLSLSPPSSSSSSYSSSFSLLSTPFHTGTGNSKARSGSIVHFGLDDDEYESGTDSPDKTQHDIYKQIKRRRNEGP